MKGPNLEKINYYKNIINVPLVASGGVASLKDISALASMKVGGVIVGKAIYDKKVILSDMFRLGSSC
jgi:phosphoribosylformimino-5-aminoimidazole carboxamide ribotide isomerase